MAIPRITYSLFFDCHTSVNSVPFGEKFSAEKFISQVKSCGVDFLTCHARCNQGNAYYNTKIGKRHPGLTFDLFKELTAEAHRQGITFSAYFNAKLSEQELIDHPEWCEQPMNPEERDHNSPFYRRACFNTAYSDHLMAMALEVAQNYPVDGFFFDCMLPSDCVCPACVEAMKKQGLNPCNPEDVRHFSIASSNAMVKRLHDAIKAIRPDALLFFNGRPFSMAKPYESHFEAECLPTGGWGYECLPILAHYLPHLADGRQIMNMTGRFNEWADFGGLRTKEGLEYDMFYGLAKGMRPDISDAMHPTYQWNQSIVDRIKEVYDDVRPYDPWCMDSTQRPEIALVGAHAEWEAYPCSPAVEAAVRMLTEMKAQFDLVDIHSSWNQYNLLIFPDDIVFDEEITCRVRAHLERGGKVIATGHSGLTADGRQFALTDMWPAVYGGDYVYDSTYYQPEGVFAANLPAMPLALYAKAAQVTPAADATTEMYFVTPYIQKGWDGLRVNNYAPPKEKSTVPFLMIKGNIAYCAGRLFEGYHALAPVQHKCLMTNLLAFFDKTPQLKISGLPSFGRAFLQNRPDGMPLVHLLAYCPEKRCESIAVEEPIEVRGVQLAVRLDGRKIRRVYQAPDKKLLEFTVDGDYCLVTVPNFAGYTLIVLE